MASFVPRSFSGFGPPGAFRLTAFAGCVAGCLMAPSVQAEANVPPALFDDPFVREELGVNEFTAPSIERIFRELRELRPIPFDKTRREINSSATFPGRPQLALNFGALLAEGFLTVEAERSDRIEEIGRGLLRLSKAMGVSDRITRHSKSLIEQGLHGDWTTLRKELGATQKDVEASMMELRDEEIAHLIALGGWLRGLEIAATTVAAAYTPERAEILHRIDLLDYFSDRLDTLNPKVRTQPLLIRVAADLKTLQSILKKPDGAPLDLGDVKQIQTLVSGLNTAIATRPAENEPAAR